MLHAPPLLCEYGGLKQACQTLRGHVRRPISHPANPPRDLALI